MRKYEMRIISRIDSDVALHESITTIYAESEGMAQRYAFNLAYYLNGYIDYVKPI